MSLSFLLPILLFFSCEKNNGSTEDLAPTNLLFTATVAANNSGVVDFTATADNAVSYEFDFGNGVFESSTTGKTTYRYPASGTYTARVTARSRSGRTLSRSTQVVANVALALVWADEFNSPGAPDPAKWTFDLGRGSGGWGNNEQQFYTNRPENVSISNGTLKITARRENFSGAQFTSTRMLTRGLFTTKYGRIEASIKLPVGVGTWPAFWMLGANIDQVGWPACGEIDIMEHKGSDENRIHGTLHYPGRSGGNADGLTTTVPNVTSTFNLYAAEWTPAHIKISVNGRVYFTFNNTASSPFNQPFFMILNVAMGGNFGGPIDPNFNNATMEVDYVRVYN